LNLEKKYYLNSMALLRQLESFDSIYGLDIEQQELLNHVSNDNITGSNLKFEGSYIFTSETKIDDFLIEDLFSSEYEYYVSVVSVKLGNISGKLRSLRICIQSNLPELLVKEMFFDISDKLSKLLSSSDLKFIKLN
jgi:hypothetical protein